MAEADWCPLCELLLKATEKAASSENCRIPPGYFLWSPGTAKESQAENVSQQFIQMLIVMHEHLERISSVLIKM